MDTSLSWEQTSALAKELAAKIKSSGFEPDYLVGITTGGLIPLGLLAQEFETKNILTVSAGSYDGRQQGEVKITYLPPVDLSGKKVLLIDEVAETGKTLKHIARAFAERCRPSQLKTATLAINSSADFRPDFYAIESDRWIDFPWEQ